MGEQTGLVVREVTVRAVVVSLRRPLAGRPAAPAAAYQAARGWFGLAGA